MCISRNIDAYAHIRDFITAYTGPGVYVLYDGRISDSNIVYIGKSNCDTVTRVTQHFDKVFDRCAVILPRNVNPSFIHNLEAAVVEEFVSKYGVLPPYNERTPRFKPNVRNFDWTTIGRRWRDVSFA